MSAASLAVLPAAPPWRRLGLQASLGAFYLGLALLYLPFIAFTAAGMVLVASGLWLALLVAPVEYALGALGCAFLAASCSQLWSVFQYLRWPFLGGATVILTLRFFFRRQVVGRPTPNRFEFLLVLFVAISGATLMTTAAVWLTALKLSALVCLFYLSSRAAAHLVEAYGPSAPRRLALGLLVYPLGLVVLPIADFFFSFGLPVIWNGRFVGYFGNPNVWAVLAILLLPWVAGALFRRSRRPSVGRAALAGLGVLTIGYTLLLSGSRAGMLGALAAATVFCLVHANRRVAAVVLLLSVLVSTRILANPDLLSKWASRYLYKHKEGQTELLQSRLRPWEAAQSNFERHPWLGLGFGVTTEGQADWAGDIRSGAGTRETGSSFWGTLSQVGLLGSSPLFLSILWAVWKAGRFAWKVKDPWFTAIYGSTLALILNAVFEGWLIAPGSFASTYFWIQCFFLNAMMCRFRPAPAERPRPESPADSWAAGWN